MRGLKVQLIATIFFMIPCIALHAQMGEVEKDTTVYLPNDDVEVIKSFRARLANAHRIDWDVQPIEFEKQPLNYKYETSVRKLDIEYRAPNIRPITLYPEEPKELFQGYLKAGYGYPNVWLGDLSYSGNLNDATQIGIKYSGQGDHFNKKALQNFIWNDANLFGKVKLSDKLRLHVGIDYQHDRRRFKHVQDSTLSQNLNQYGLNARIEMPIENVESWNYYVESSYHRSKLSMYDYRENLIRLGGGLSYSKNSLKMGLTNASTFLKSNDSLVNGFVSQSQLAASYIHKRNKYEAGVDYLYGRTLKHTFLPHFNVSFQLLSDVLFVRLKGVNKLNINNVYDLHAMNPYISRFGKVDHHEYYTSEYDISAYGKLNSLEYSLSGGYAIYKNVPIYQLANVGKDTVSHIVQNIDGNAPFVKFSVNYTLSKSIHIGLSGYQYFLRSKNEAHFSEWLNTHFNVHSKIVLLEDKLSLEPSFMLSRVQGSASNDHSNRWIPELGMEVNYVFTKHVSVFLKGNNLLNSKGERYIGHPIVGTTAMIGIKCKW